MKKILLSTVMSLGLLSLVLVFTAAYFSDTETSTGNVLGAGTIDIAVDGENPWISTTTFTLADMLPGESNSSEDVIANVGTRELVLWKKITVTARNDGDQSEPECTDQGGTWTNPGGPCTYGATNNNDLDSQLDYGMEVDLGSGYVYNIDPTWGLNLADVDTLWVPLGRVNAGSSISVRETFDFSTAAGNEYQGDEIVFDVTYYAEQLGAPGPSHTTLGVVVDNKNTTDWAPVVGDGTFGIVRWDNTGAYTVRAWGLTANNHRLQAWDSATDTDLGFLSAAQVPTSGELNFSGTAAGLNTYAGAKIWLREVSTWSNANTLWESNLIN